MADVGDAEAGQGVDDGVDDGGRGADGAGLADALDPEGVGGAAASRCGRVVIAGTSEAAGTR